MFYVKKWDKIFMNPEISKGKMNHKDLHCTQATKLIYRGHINISQLLVLEFTMEKDTKCRKNNLRS